MARKMKRTPKAAAPKHKAKAKVTVVPVDNDPAGILAEIKKQQGLVDSARDDQLHKREELKAANGYLKRMQEKLSALIHEDLSLFNQNGDNGQTEKVKAGPVADNWRSVRLDALPHLTATDVAKLAEAGMNTVGDVAEYTADTPLTAVNGVGETAQERIERGLDTVWVDRQATPCADAETQAAAAEAEGED